MATPAKEQKSALRMPLSELIDNPEIMTPEQHQNFQEFIHNIVQQNPERIQELPTLVADIVFNNNVPDDIKAQYIELGNNLIPQRVEELKSQQSPKKLNQAKQKLDSEIKNTDALIKLQSTYAKIRNSFKNGKPNRKEKNLRPEAVEQIIKRALSGEKIGLNYVEPSFPPIFNAKKEQQRREALRLAVFEFNKTLAQMPQSLEYMPDILSIEALEIQKNNLAEANKQFAQAQKQQEKLPDNTKEINYLQNYMDKTNPNNTKDLMARKIAKILEQKKKNQQNKEELARLEAENAASPSYKKHIAEQEKAPNSPAKPIKKDNKNFNQQFTPQKPTIEI